MKNVTEQLKTETDLATGLIKKWSERANELLEKNHKSDLEETDKKVEKAAFDIEKLDRGQDGSSGSSGSSGAAENATDFIINSKSEEFTLDGTLSQAYSSVFTSGPKAKTKNKKIIKGHGYNKTKKKT